jgi:hypothetical protein
MYRARRAAVLGRTENSALLAHDFPLAVAKCVAATQRSLGDDDEKRSEIDTVCASALPQIALDRARIHTVIRQFVSATMSQHVRMDFDVEARRAGNTFHHGLKATI